MFRGSAPAKIDDKGRLKLPTDFRRHLEEGYGPDLFVTSVRGDSALIYPLRVWEEIEARLVALPSTDRVRQRYLERISYYGQQVRIDKQGRFVLPQLLRESARTFGEVVVSSRLDHLEVWDRQRLESRFQEDPFSDDDFQSLADRGI